MAVFLLEASGEDLFPVFSIFQKLPAFLGSWSLPPPPRHITPTCGSVVTSPYCLLTSQWILVYPPVGVCTAEDGETYAHVGEGTTIRITSKTSEMPSGYKNGCNLWMQCETCKTSWFPFSVSKTTYRHIRNSEPVELWAVTEMLFCPAVQYSSYQLHIRRRHLSFKLYLIVIHLI